MSVSPLAWPVHVKGFLSPQTLAVKGPGYLSDPGYRPKHKTASKLRPWNLSPEAQGTVFFWGMARRKRTEPMGRGTVKPH